MRYNKIPFPLYVAITVGAQLNNVHAFLRRVSAGMNFSVIFSIFFFRCIWKLIFTNLLHDEYKLQIY